MCWSRDCHGMNPIHIAAMNGHLEILEQLIRLDRFPAMEKVDGGHTVLHLCVKHRRFTELRFLVRILGDVVNSRNDDGETILHLAARYEDVVMLRWLVDNTTIDKQAKEWRGNELAMETLMALDKLTEALMVVAVLIVAMVFQATISPPGRRQRVAGGLFHTQRRGSCDGGHSSRDLQKLRASKHGGIHFLLWDHHPTNHQKVNQKPWTFLFHLVYGDASMIFVAMSYNASVKAITPNEVKLVANGVKISVLLFICVFPMFLFSAMVKSRFSTSSKIISLIPNRNGDHIQLETV